MDLLSRQLRGLLVGGDEGSCRFAVGVRRGHGHEFLLRVAQGRELAAEDAAGVDVDRAVEPIRFRNRRVAVNDHRRAPVFGSPVVTHRQAELVGLAAGLAVQGKVANLAGAASLHLGLHPGVRDH